MTGSSSKLLQVQSKWYRERKPKQHPKPDAKKSKNYSEPKKMGIKGCKSVRWDKPNDFTKPSKDGFESLDRSLHLCRRCGCPKYV